MYKAIFIGHTTLQASKPSTVSNERAGEGRDIHAIKLRGIKSKRTPCDFNNLLSGQLRGQFSSSTYKYYHFQGQEFLDILLIYIIT